MTPFWGTVGGGGLTFKACSEQGRANKSDTQSATLSYERLGDDQLLFKALLAILNQSKFSQDPHLTWMSSQVGQGNIGAEK